MEVDSKLAASVNDALLKKDSLPQEIENSNENEQKDDLKKFIVEKKPVESTDKKLSIDNHVNLPEKDDLLEKIEEAVKDNSVISQKAEEEIKTTSDDDFLKKLDKIAAKTVSSNEVVVNKLILNISDEEKSQSSSNNGTSKQVQLDILPKNEKNEVENHNISETILKEKVTLEAEIEPDSASFKESESEKTSVLAVEQKETSEAMSVDHSEASNECMEVDAEEKIDMEVEEKAATPEVVDVDIKEPSPEVVGIEIKAATPEVVNLEIIEPAPETDVEMKGDEVPTSTNEVIVDAQPELTPTVIANVEKSVESNSAEKVKSSTQEDAIPVELSADSSSENTESKPLEDAAIISDTDETKKNVVEINSIKVVNKAVNSVQNIESTPRSRNTTPVSTPNVVFNSTPIDKQFEISSGNVSKISQVAEISHTENKEEDKSEKSESKTSEDDATTACTTTETEQQSSDGVNKYIEVVKKFNGLADTTTDEEDSSSIAKVHQSTSTVTSTAEVMTNHINYEVNICYDGSNLKSISVERIDLPKKTFEETGTTSGEISMQSSSSNGSVSSLPAFSLPAANLTEVSTSTSTASQTISKTLSRNQHTVSNIEELCNFMIDEFTKIKNSLHPDVVGTPKNTRRNQKSSPAIKEPQTPASGKGKRGVKRTLQEDDVELTPKSKQAKKDLKDTPKKDAEPVVEEIKGQCVLAKWVDKKYYAGNITGEKPGNKFVVLFEDGASKTLPRESIVFGEDDVLPLQDQSVHALINEDDYETGIVLSIEKNSNKVIYTVKTETKTVSVTASDLYLQDDQAKIIQKIRNLKTGENDEDSLARSSRKRAAASPGTPEAGFSGGIGKRGKRQKRYS